ncbi:MAG TPA: DUF58 domain-containing protein [Saprospiraceae bacterium]|mgnify:CR=1 FL=1|nr:DUF58 domain-containing protein [Saprospiraceae bacterium]HRX29037.1 DUF58 domain-containing protein [Saprospiraceae bacterium]
MDTSELLKKVKKIEIKTRNLTNHLFSGEYQSAFKGRGMSFSEVRDYSFGDDIRSIDWNVTARTGNPHIKIFEEERELTVILLIDVSRSTLFGAHNEYKKDLIAELSAVISFSAITNNDKVGAIFFAENIVKYLPPKKGKQSILRIIREVLDLEPEGKTTNLKEALNFLNQVQKKKAIVFVLSDFMAEDYELPLRIAARRHDLIGLHIFDHAEYELPNVGLIKSHDAETGESIYLDSSDAETRNLLKNYFDENQNYMQRTFLKYKSDVVSLSTDEDYVKPLYQFFKKRNA